MNTAKNANLWMRSKEKDFELYDTSGELIIESVIEAVHTAMKK